VAVFSRRRSPPAVGAKAGRGRARLGLCRKRPLPRLSPPHFSPTVATLLRALSPKKNNAGRTPRQNGVLFLGCGPSELAWTGLRSMGAVSRADLGSRDKSPWLFAPEEPSSVSPTKSLCVRAGGRRALLAPRKVWLGPSASREPNHPNQAGAPVCRPPRGFREHRRARSLRRCRRARPKSLPTTRAR